MLSSVSQYRPWCSTGSVLPAHCCSCRRDQRSMRPPSWVWRDTLSEYRPLGSFSLTALRHKTSTSMGCGVRVHSTYTERKSERNISLCKKKKKKRFVESKRKIKTLQKIISLKLKILFSATLYYWIFTPNLSTCVISSKIYILTFALEWIKFEWNELAIHNIRRIHTGYDQNGILA